MDGISKQDKRDFLDMCRKLVQKKVDAKERELEKKKDNSSSDAIIDKIQNDLDKEMNAIGIKYTKRLYGELSQFGKPKRVKNLFSSEYDWDVENVAEDIIDDDWIDGELDKYKDKLDNKLFELEQEIMFADMPKLKKMFDELRSL